jgi:hypothetical protein
MPIRAGYVLVHDARSGKTALDGAVAVRLHQALEEPVAEDENVLPAMSASPNPSNSTVSPSGAITVSTTALKILGESTENGIASRAIHSSSEAYVGVGRDM